MTQSFEQRPERRWRALEAEDQRRPRRSLLVALVLLAATLMTLDHTGESSPLEPVREAVGEALAPVQRMTAAAVRPFAKVPLWLRTQGELRDDVQALTAENAKLRDQLATTPYDRNRLAEYDGLSRSARDLARTLVPARVTGYGPSQSFSRTVTIDAGSAAGVAPDATVINTDGLVGRVLRVTPHSATVLLIMDADSVVGARLGENLKVGFLRGHGQLGADARLDLELVDDVEIPAQGDTVVTWGSDGGGGPYLPGLPVGTVTEVFTSLRDSSQRAVIKPYVDFSALDVVGVVVPDGTRSDRSVLTAEGRLQ